MAHRPHAKPEMALHLHQLWIGFQFERDELAIPLYTRNQWLPLEFRIMSLNSIQFCNLCPFTETIRSPRFMLRAGPEATNRLGNEEPLRIVPSGSV